jgi:hypothetical protein
MFSVDAVGRYSNRDTDHGVAVGWAYGESRS